MTPRLATHIWVGALLRRAQAAGAFATVMHKGAAEAGAVIIVVAKASGFDVYTPAPQSMALDDDAPLDRQFEQRLSDVDQMAVDSLIENERRFDTDLWAVEIEDRDGNPHIEVMSP